MNALFLKDLADKTRRGPRGRVEKGKAGGGLCYGYRPVKHMDSKGQAIRGDREIVEHEAEVVRRIFNEFAAGASPKTIVHKFNREGIAGPSGKGWTPSTIHGNPKRGNGILNNELYIGKLVWNRQRFLKDPASGRRISRPNPKERWLVTEVPELRIVSDELWAAAKHRQENSAKAFTATSGSKGERLNRLRRQSHLLSGLLICGACGGPYTIRGRDRYACANHYARGTCGNRLGVARVELEARVLTGLQDHLVPAEAVAAGIRAYHEERNRLNHARRAQSELDRKELIKVEKSIRAVISSIEEGMYHPSMKARAARLVSSSSMTGSKNRQRS
jgi:site-specific DNA recombinase